MEISKKRLKTIIKEELENIKNISESQIPQDVQDFWTDSGLGDRNKWPKEKIDQLQVLMKFRDLTNLEGVSEE